MRTVRAPIVACAPFDSTLRGSLLASHAVSAILRAAAGASSIPRRRTPQMRRAAARRDPAVRNALRGIDSELQPSRRASSRNAHAPAREASAARAACLATPLQRSRRGPVTERRSTPRALRGETFPGSLECGTPRRSHSARSSECVASSSGRATRTVLLRHPRRTQGIPERPRLATPRPSRMRSVSSTSSA
jgi:hypothetical protein